MFFDVHAHMDHEKFKDDLPNVLDNALKANVKLILTSGYNPETNLKALELSYKFQILQPTLGIYPTNLLPKDLQDQLDFIKKHKDKIKGIGEVGMDRPRNRNEVNIQKEIFLKCIDLAKKLDKPLIIHSRGAEKHVINLLEQESAQKVVLHAFSGPEKYAKKAAELKFFFSIPPRVITDENFQAIEKLIPHNLILTETDAPFLGQKKDEKNEPKNVVQTVSYLTNKRNINMEEQIEKNMKKILSA